MRVAVFSTKPYDETFLRRANQEVHELIFLEARLTPETAALAEGMGRGLRVRERRSERRRAASPG